MFLWFLIGYQVWNILTFFQILFWIIMKVFKSFRIPQNFWIFKSILNSFGMKWPREWQRILPSYIAHFEYFIKVNGTQRKYIVIFQKLDFAYILRIQKKKKITSSNCPQNQSLWIASMLSNRGTTIMTFLTALAYNIRFLVGLRVFFAIL